MRPRADLVLPEHLRDRLARPFGPVLQTPDLAAAVAGRPFVTVGDVVSLTCIREGLRPRFVVCDLKTQREAPDPRYESVLLPWADRVARVHNPPGTVTVAAWDAIVQAIGHDATTTVVVDGEEDLLGLVVLSEAPDEWLMLYGLPGRGVVGVDVGSVRNEARAMLEAMPERVTP